MTNPETPNVAEGSPQLPFVDPRLPPGPMVGVSEKKEAAAERIAHLVIFVFAGALLLSFLSPALTYWIVSQCMTPANPVTPEQVEAIWNKLGLVGLDYVKTIAGIFSSLLTLILSYYFFRGKGGE